MNTFTIYILKGLRKIYKKTFKPKPATLPDCIQDPDVASKAIYDLLMDDKPCMIARFGSTEFSCLMNYLSVKEGKIKVIDFIMGKAHPWWWDKSIMNQMQMWSGFFPPTQEKIEKFCELMLEDMKEVDILGSWLNDEKKIESFIGLHQKINIELLNPYFTNSPWTLALEGKKILVVHPFAKLIEKQYYKRNSLFKNNLLPNFQLKTVEAIQSLAGEKTTHDDWFNALKFMLNEIDNIDYDICLVGAGAYGFHIAAHIKRNGKKCIHMGGSLQLLFGIIGKRWENPNYNDIYNYSILINENWVRPGDIGKPINSEIVEGGCYW